MSFRQLNYHLCIIGEDHVNAVQNLLLSNFCIVLTNFGIRIGEGMPCTIPTNFVAYHVMSVIALYTKTSGKNGHHSAIPCVANVAAISYVGVQIFQLKEIVFSMIQLNCPFQHETFSVVTLHPSFGKTCWKDHILSERPPRDCCRWFSTIQIIVQWAREIQSGYKTVCSAREEQDCAGVRGLGSGHVLHF